MIDLKLSNATGDIDLSGGDLNLATENEAILQNIGTRFRFQRGEWFLNLLVGAPLFGGEGTIFGSGRGDLETVRAIVTQIIEGAPGMQRVLTLDIDLDANRALHVTWQGQRTTGEVVGPFTESLIFGDL